MRRSSQATHYRQHSRTKINPTFAKAKAVIQMVPIIVTTTTTGRATTTVTTVVVQMGATTTRTADLVVAHTGTMLSELNK